MNSGNQNIFRGALFLLVLLLAACGGGGGASPDTTPPTVSQVIPANNATGVAVNSAVSVTFSEAMAATTVNAATFTLTPSGGAAITGTVAYSGTTATFTPSANLAYSTVYTAVLTTGAKDIAGNPIASNYTWTFTTAATPPTLQTITVAIALSPILVGETTSATAMGHYSDLSSADLTNQVTWTSSAGGATVSSTGQIAGVSSSTETITATLGAVSGSSVVRVLAPFSLSTPNMVPLSSNPNAYSYGSELAVGVPAGTYVFSLVGINLGGGGTVVLGNLLENNVGLCNISSSGGPVECRAILTGSGHRLARGFSANAGFSTGIATVMQVPGAGPYSTETGIVLAPGAPRASMAVTAGPSTYTVTGQTAYTIGVFGMTGDVNLSATTGGAGAVTCTHVSLAGTAPEECRVSGAAPADIVNVSVTAAGADAGYVLLAK